MPSPSQCADLLQLTFSVAASTFMLMISKQASRFPELYCVCDTL